MLNQTKSKQLYKKKNVKKLIEELSEYNIEVWLDQITINTIIRSIKNILIDNLRKASFSIEITFLNSNLIFSF